MGQQRVIQLQAVHCLNKKHGLLK